MVWTFESVRSLKVNILVTRMNLSSFKANKDTSFISWRSSSSHAANKELLTCVLNQILSVNLILFQQWNNKYFEHLSTKYLLQCYDSNFGFQMKMLLVWSVNTAWNTLKYYIKFNTLNCFLVEFTQEATLGTLAGHQEPTDCSSLPSIIVIFPSKANACFNHLRFSY